MIKNVEFVQKNTAQTKQHHSSVVTMEISTSHVGVVPGQRQQPWVKQEVLAPWGLQQYDTIMPLLLNKVHVFT